MRVTRSQAGSHTPPLSDMWLAAGVTLVVIAAATALVYLGLESLHPVAETTGSKTKSAGTLDVIKTAIAVVAFADAALGGVYAYRKQRLAEGDAHRSDADQFAYLYTSAADQLGHDQPAARLAGVYAMARLADNWDDQRQTCIEVLCAYLRLPYDHGNDVAEREVRRTIVRVIRDHLRPGRGLTSWQGYNFSFQGAVFEEGDLSGTHLSDGHVSFHGARFVSGTFHLSGAHFEGANVWFNKAHFSGAVVDFSNATFDAGLVTFDGAEQTAGAVKFDGAQYGGTELRWGSLPVPPGAPVSSTP